MKTTDLIVKLLTDVQASIADVQTDMKKVRTEDIPALQVSHATLNQRVQDEAKYHSRAYARIYGAITIVISLTGLAVAYFNH